MAKFPSLKQLHYLVTLYDTRHFGEAAKKCFVSQSTLRAGIQHLEDIIGYQLIERDNKTLIFSAIGEDVILRSRQILSLSQDLMELKQKSEHPMKGQVRLGCIPTIAPFLLGKFVQCINEQYPDLHLLMREDTTENLLRALKNGEMDVLIIALPFDIGSLESRIVGTDAFKMVFSKHYMQNIGASLPIEYEQLPDASVFLLKPEHCLSDHSVSACQLTSKDKINSFTASSLHTLVHMVSNGLGTTFIPEMAIKHGLLDNLDLVAVNAPGIDSYRHIGVVWRPTSCRTETFEIISDLIQQLLNDEQTRESPASQLERKLEYRERALSR